MMEIAIANLSAVPPGEGRNFEIAGRKLAVFHTRCGNVYATQAECPHKQGPLADGLVGGCVLICPLHSWKFDLANGQPLFGDCKIETYPARLDEKQQIVISLP
jgi:nitrite reductase (NADH) small subunit